MPDASPVYFWLEKDYDRKIQLTKNHTAQPKSMAVRKKIWIDLDNSPHVLFFAPVAEALREEGFEVILISTIAPW